MNSQTIVTRANANHFGHPVTTTTEKTPTEKNRDGASAKTPALKGKENGPGVQATGKKKSEVKPQTQVAPASPEAAKHLASPEVETVFRLDAPAAHTVLLAGDFSNWEKAPIKMLKGGGGVWHTKVSLAHGRHHYRFVVDGEWQEDPNATHRVANPFGTFNSVTEIA